MAIGVLPLKICPMCRSVFPFGSPLRVYGDCCAAKAHPPGRPQPEYACVECKASLGFTFPRRPYCGDACKTAARQRQQAAVYQFTRDQGLCTACFGERDRPDRVQCKVCREIHAMEYRLAYEEKRKRRLAATSPLPIPVRA